MEKVPKSRRYRFCPEGYPICVVFLRPFERIYASLTSGLLRPISHDCKLEQQKRMQFDRLYQRVADDLEKLMIAVGLKVATAGAAGSSPTRSVVEFRETYCGPHVHTTSLAASEDDGESLTCAFHAQTDSPAIP